MALTIDVRPAAADDLTAVLSVHGAHNHDMRAGPASPKEHAMWDRMMNTDDLTVYLAEIDGQPAGTATVMRMPNITYDCAPTAFIEAVVVVPEFRRWGVATLILDRVLQDVKAEGCDKVQLLSHKRHASDGGHALYAKAGFTAEAEGFRLYLKPPHRSPAP